jgi:hypothetical protein
VSGIDFGNVALPGSISGVKFEDLDADGVRDPEEPGLMGWTIYLDQNGNEALDEGERSTVTGQDGVYVFTDQQANVQYLVREVLSAGWTPTFPGDGVHTVELGPGQDVVGVDFGNHQPTGGGEGFTPGFWKQTQHFDAWVGFDPSDSYEAVFGVETSDNPTLLEALGANGGGENALLRHSTAALLNASHGGVNYVFTQAEIIESVQDAYTTGEFESAKDPLETENEREGSLEVEVVGDKQTGGDAPANDTSGDETPNGGGNAKDKKDKPAKKPVSAQDLTSEIVQQAGAWVSSQIIPQLRFALPEFFADTSSSGNGSLARIDGFLFEVEADGTQDLNGRSDLIAGDLAQRMSHLYSPYHLERADDLFDSVDAEAVPVASQPQDLVPSIDCLPRTPQGASSSGEIFWIPTTDSIVY